MLSRLTRRLVRVLGYLWATPGTLIGLLLSIPYGAHRWRWFDGCLEATTMRMIGDPAAQTHGWLIFYASNDYRRNKGLRVHERVHVTQALWGGPLYLIAYALHFLWRWADLRNWRAAYWGVWAECQAYEIQYDYLDGKHPGQWGEKLPSATRGNGLPS
jgi:hypothetical protein